MSSKRVTSNWRVVSVLMLITVLSLVLTACGGTDNPKAKDNNYIVPTYTEAQPQTAIASNPNFQAQILDPRNVNFSGQTVQVFTIDPNIQLQTVRDFYRKAMLDAGWSDRSALLIDQNALGANGWVEGFVKESHVTGMIMTTPGADKGVLREFWASGLLPKDKNVLIVTQSIYSATPVANPIAPVTPVPNTR